MVLKGYIRKTFLPPDVPENVIVCPTMNRWGDRGNGPLPKMIQSVQSALDADGLSDQTWMLVSDATTPSKNGRRAEILENIDQIDHPAKLFFLNPEMQEKVADIVSRITGVRKRVVEAILSDSGYASQRIKMDTVLAGVVNVRGEATKVLTLDDDTMVLPFYGIVKQDRLPEGAENKINSQVIIPDEEISDNIMNFRWNRLGPLFEHLGMTIDEVRHDYPHLKATRTQKDTMNMALEGASADGVSQFEVTCDDGPEMEDVGRARVLATTVTKYGVPDYRTVKIAQEHFRREFPEKEVERQSMLSGDVVPYAFMESKTNVDSAALSRLFDGKTSMYPWWFVTDEAISNDNPLRAVTGHYRADNELLPSLMTKISDAGAENYVYLSGLDSQVYHNRARSGYRPDLHEQAAASLVGNLAAVEAVKRIKIDQDTGVSCLEKFDHDFAVPVESLKKVFHEMKLLAHICVQKIGEINERKTNSHILYERDRVLIRRYVKKYEEIKAKLADFDFELFSKYVNDEIRRQLEFYGEVLEAYSAVVTEVQNLIRDGKYPVEEFVPGMKEKLVRSSTRRRSTSGFTFGENPDYEGNVVNF